MLIFGRTRLAAQIGLLCTRFERSQAARRTMLHHLEEFTLRWGGGNTIVICNSFYKESKGEADMALQTRSWEQALLSLAYEAIQPNTNTSSAANVEASRTGRGTVCPPFSQDLLLRAYAHCDEITSIHSRSFHMASSLLPTEKRHAARALYAFCRVTDDLVDCGGDQIAQSLSAWHDRILTTHPPEEDLVAVAWTDARLRFGVPQRFAEQLIEGVERDLYQTRYETFRDLASYCYGVASTVGLMSMHIIGYEGEEAIPYAIKLGVALQLTNILRDVAEDWRLGRLYLPQEELEAFGLGEASLDAAVVTEKWRDFMRFQIARNRRLYQEAIPGIALLDPDGRFAIGAAAELYRAILDDIEQHDYDVFSRRSHVGTWGKISRLPGIWWRSKRIRVT